MALRQLRERAAEMVEPLLAVEGGLRCRRAADEADVVARSQPLLGAAAAMPVGVPGAVHLPQGHGVGDRVGVVTALAEAKAQAVAARPEADGAVVVACDSLLDWQDRPSGAAPVDVEDEVPDDTGVDHTDDEYDE